MKRLLTVVAGMAAGAALYAMPVLNPAEPALLTDGVFFCDKGDCWGLKIGYRGDFVYNQRFEDRVTGAVQDFEFYSNALTVTVNLWDRVDIYGFVGPAWYEYHNVQTSNAPGANPADVAVDAYSRTNTLWGVGGKAVLWETCWGSCGTTYVGFDGQYEYLNQGSLDRAFIEGANAAVNGTGYGFKQWQVALGIAHRIWNLVPYLAIKWSEGRAPLTGATVGTSTGAASATLHKLKTYQNLGWAFGVTLVDSNRMSVTAEGRFKDETALSVAAEFRF